MINFSPVCLRHIWKAGDKGPGESIDKETIAILFEKFSDSGVDNA